MPPVRYVFTYKYCPIIGSGFPHSEIFGSMLTYSSPKHIGVSTVLHRLLVPRHPPCALYNLTCSASISFKFLRHCSRQHPLVPLNTLRCFLHQFLELFASHAPISFKELTSMNVLLRYLVFKERSY